MTHQPVPASRPGTRLSVGVDIVSVDRVRELLRTNPPVVRRMLAAQEIEHCTDDRGELDPDAVSGRIAAKEAAFKALGHPGPLPWNSLLVRTTDIGSPELCITDPQLYRTAGDEVTTTLSISHDHGVAVAVALLGFSTKTGDRSAGCSRTASPLSMEEEHQCRN